MTNGECLKYIRILMNLLKKSKEFDSNIGYIRIDIFQSNMRCQVVGRFETWTAAQ